MEWTRSETLALASHSCAQCHGLGLRFKDAVDQELDPIPNQTRSSQPCNCVLRNIFRACYMRFRETVAKEKAVSRVFLEAVHGHSAKRFWGRKDEEYMADFCLVTKRSLSRFDYQLFTYHYLLGADWKLCCRKLKIEKGEFFHQVYRIQQKLGRVFRELEPYALYPLSEYFDGGFAAVKPCLIPEAGKVTAIRPPLTQSTSGASPQQKAA